MSNQKKDYYKILGLSKEAEPEHIKRAYKKLAIKWHPDKNPGREKEAEEKFKEIAEAYAVLSNERKRRQYDMYGTVDFDSERETSNSDHFGYGDFGFAPSGFEGFTFERAEGLFRDVFGDEFEQYGFGKHRPNDSGSNYGPGNDFQPNFQQGFGGDFMGGRGFGNFFNDFGFGGGFGGGRGQEPFNNDFFSSFGMGGMGFNFGSMNSMSSMSSMGGGFGGGASQSVSTSTIIRNGKEVTVTKTTMTNPDGTTHTEVQEHVKDGGRTIASNRYVGQGENQRIENGNKQIGYGNSNRGVKTQK